MADGSHPLIRPPAAPSNGFFVRRETCQTMSAPEHEEETPVLPLTKLIGMGGFAGYLLLGIEVMRVASIRGRSAAEYDQVDGSALLQVAYVGLCALYGFHRWLRSPQRGAFHLLKTSPLLPLVVYTILCGLSTLWSQNPPITLYRSVECMAYIVLAAVVCDNLNLRCSPQDFIEWLIFWGAWFYVWDALRMVRIMGPSVLISRFAFRFGNFGLSMVFFLALFVSRRRILSVPTVLCTVLSTANVTYFGILFGLAPGLCVGDRRYRIALFFLAGLGALSFLTMGSEVVHHTLFYGKEGVGIEHTTGRDRIWRYCMDYGMERFLYGYGFVAGETEALGVTGVRAITTHNVFLSAFLSVGIAGPLLFVLFFAWLASLSFHSDIPMNWRPAFLGMTIMLFITSFASPGLGARVYGAWLPAALVSAAISVLANRERLIQMNMDGQGVEVLPGLRGCQPASGGFGFADD